MDSDNIPNLLKALGQSVENRLADKMRGRDEEDAARRREREIEPMPRMRSESGMESIEPDWEELDKKANMIIVRYTMVSTAANLLPFGLDVALVTATFTKMVIELAGVYQVIVSNKRARQISWAFATTTGTVLGTAYGASQLAKQIPGSYFFGVLVQAPIVGAVAWAAGDALKGYFKETRRGREPSLESLRDSFARTLHLNLAKTKTKPGTPKGGKLETVIASAGTSNGGAPAAAADAGPLTTGQIVEKIAGLHELLRAGAITQTDFDRKKTELLSRM
jgi:uncharacterized protein (DUF697 family)